jgi:hypothetical protein
MGKKIIITESQIETLKVLLEREMGIEESVIVANKNPFRHEEFKDARREYNSSLKNGERFYVLDKSYIKNIDEEISQIKKDFLSNLKGKSLRYSLSDFEGTTYYEYMVGNLFSRGKDKFKNMICRLRFNDEINRVNFECRLDDNTDYTFENSLTSFKNDGIFWDVVPGFGTSYLSFNGVNNLYKTQIANTIRDLEQKQVIQIIPDEFFEIREIKRENTDL